MSDDEQSLKEVNRQLKINSMQIKPVLMNAGLLISIDDLNQLWGAKLINRLKNKYTIRVLDPITNRINETRLYRIVNLNDVKYICLPKYSLYYLDTKGLISEVDNRLVEGKNIKFTYTGKSNPNQEKIVSYIMENSFKNKFGLNGVTLKVGAGLGKTYIAMDLISKINKKTLIVVPNTYLLDQWIMLLKRYFPNNRLGTIYTKKHQDGDIIVAIINSAAKIDTFRISNEFKSDIPMINLFEKVGFVIFDESQSYISKEYRKVYNRVHSKYMIGLSATPDIRENKMDFVHISNVGPILDAEEIPEYQKDDDTFIAEVDIIKYQAPNQYVQVKLTRAGILDYSYLLNNLIEDPYRNQLIINCIVDMIDKGLFTFVFSDRRAHLQLLYGLLEKHISDKEYTMSIPEVNQTYSSILYGGSNNDDINKAKKKSNIIFTTYQYSAVGVSIEKMNGMILATPRKSNLVQIISRIFRLGSDRTQKRYIVDIVDNRTRIKNQYYVRKQAYMERNCDINISSVKYTDVDVMCEQEVAL